MNLLKKILIHILIIIIILMSCFSIYFANKHGLNIYAAVNDDAIYVPLRSQSDAVIAFQSYCKSRDLTIEGSLTDAVTTFTTGAFNSACNEIGIDITQLQSEIKAEYDSSGKPVKFFFNDTGVMAMNRIFAQFLQDNELEVGDTNVNQLVYSGHYVTDQNGNSVLCFVVHKNTTSSAYSISYSDYDYIGTKYLIGGSEIVPLLETTPSSLQTYFIDKNGNGSDLVTLPLSKGYNSSSTVKSRIYRLTSTNELGKTIYGLYGSAYNQITDQVTYDGVVCVIYNSYNNRYWLGSYCHDIRNDTYLGYATNEITIPSEDNESASINIVSVQINNNVYEGDTYITNEGDVINNNPTIPYDPHPDGGGTTTPSTGIGDGNGTQLTLPDLDLNLPSINWSIGDLTEKFPFSIPFDLIAFLTILNAEPETPEIQGNLNLAIVNWEFDYDLHQFDNLAALLRNLEFIGFCIGLVLITRSLLR